jgi:hypothetical protein
MPLPVVFTDQRGAPPPSLGTMFVASMHANDSSAGPPHRIVGTSPLMAGVYGAALKAGTPRSKEYSPSAPTVQGDEYQARIALRETNQYAHCPMFAIRGGAV